MLETEQNLSGKDGPSEQTTILGEYNEIVQGLKRELELCKAEQNNIRAELELLQRDNQNAEDIKNSFNRIHSEECGGQDIHKKQVENLQERIVLLQTEKDSVLQLWHIALNTIDVLEEELKTFRADGKGTKFYQEQAYNVREAYSEAIKTLEAKLLQAKENFVKQQALWQTNKEKVEILTKERDDVLQKFKDLQRDVQDKDRNNQLTIETLKKELSYARAENSKMMRLKLDLESRLNETKRFAENIVEKDRETKMKMAEALELVDTAVREKDLILHREALVLEEKARLEHRLTAVANEYDAKIQELNKKFSNEYERNESRHLMEVKELKLELKEKSVALEKVQRELFLTQEELKRIQRDSEDVLRKSNANIQEYEQKLKYMELQLQVQDETKNKNKYDLEIIQLRQKISILEDKLIVSNDKLKKLEQQSNKDDEAKQANRKSTDIMKQYANLESRLARTLGDKEDLVLQLKSLKHDFDYEIQKRDNEMHCLENKIHEMKINLQKTNYTKENKTDDLHPSSRDTKNKHTLDIKVENKCHCCQLALSDYVNKLQEKFDKRTKELIQHVQVHQKLSRRWRDEAKSLTTRFQGKTRELRAKINVLQKENNQLSKELLLCRQQDINRSNEANEIR